MKKITILTLIISMFFTTVAPTYAQVHLIDSTRLITLENGVKITEDKFIQFISDSRKCVIIESDNGDSSLVSAELEIEQEYGLLRSASIPTTLEGEWKIWLVGLGLVTVKLYNDTIKIGDTIISASDALWDTIVNAVENLVYDSLVDSIPSRFRDGNVVDLDKFDNKVSGRNAYKEKGGWEIEKDRAGSNSHGGSAWKLKDKKGKRKATLDKNGKILRK